MVLDTVLLFLCSSKYENSANFVLSKCLQINRIYVHRKIMHMYIVRKHIRLKVIIMRLVLKLKLTLSVSRSSFNAKC